MDNINDLQTKILNLETQSDLLINEKEFNIETFIKSNKKYIIIYTLTLITLIFIKPFFIKSKTLSSGKIIYNIDISKLFIWSLLFSFIIIRIINKKNITIFD